MQRSSLVRTAIVLSCTLLPGPLAAQPAPGPRPLCWRGAPKASCRVVILTDFGLYVLKGTNQTPVGVDPFTGVPSGFERRLAVRGRVTADWGLLFNVGRRDAVGFSLFGSNETTQFDDEAELAGFLRYRRWLGNERSLDLALGTPLMLRNSGALRGPYGLVKLNLNDWFGVALRPELRRSLDYRQGPPRPQSKFHLSAGIEIGQKPGFGLSAIAGALLGVLTLIKLHNID